MVTFEPAPVLPAWLARELPFERRLACLDSGRRVHFVDTGSGRPVLLMHGNPAWSFLWRKVIAKLPERRCVAPDLLGCGLSEKLRSPNEHRLDLHVSTIAALGEAIDLRDLVV